MRVCSPCLRGLSLNLSQCHTSNFGKKLKCQIRKLIQDANLQFNVSKKKNDLLISLPSQKILDKIPFKLEISTTSTRKTEALEYGAQFQCITIEIKERIETQNPPVWPPTKPPTDRHSTNFTKELKSLKVSHLWSYPWQVPLFNLDERNWPIYIARKVKFCFKIKNIAEDFSYAYSACLFVVLFHITWRYSGELFIQFQIKFPCEWTNN